MMCNTLREQLSTKRTKFSHLQFYFFFFFYLAEFMLKSMCLFQPFWDIVQHIIYTELLQWLIVINYHPEFFASQAGLQAIFAFLSNQELMLQSVLLIVLHSCNNILKKKCSFASEPSNFLRNVENNLKRQKIQAFLNSLCVWVQRIHTLLLFCYFMGLRPN